MLCANPKMASLSVDRRLSPANTISPTTTSASTAYATQSLRSSISLASYYRAFVAARHVQRSQIRQTRVRTSA
jgi:hypothetical protein